MQRSNNVLCIAMLLASVLSFLDQMQWMRKQNFHPILFPSLSDAAPLF